MVPKAEGISAQMQWKSRGTLWEGTLKSFLQASLCQQNAELRQPSRWASSWEGLMDTQDPETSAGGAEGDLGDNADSGSDVCGNSEICDCARVQGTVPAQPEAEVTAAFEHPEDQEPAQVQVQDRDTSASAVDRVPDLLNTSPVASSQCLSGVPWMRRRLADTWHQSQSHSECVTRSRHRTPAGIYGRLAQQSVQHAVHLERQNVSLAPPTCGDKVLAKGMNFHHATGPRQDLLP